jgi:hypothetical protein
MLVKLAFSVAIRAHADILLIDEVLAVGDASFQHKCFDVFRRLKAEGRTIVFVSHDLGTVKEFSDRVMVLDHGQAVGTFGPSKAIAEYQRLNEEKANRDLTGAEAQAAGPNGRSERPSIRSIQMLAKDGQPTHVVHRGDGVRVVLTVDNAARVPLHAGVSIYRSDGFYCFGTNTFLAEYQPASGELVEVEVAFDDLPLQRGSYYLLVGLMGDKPDTIYEFREHAYDFQVSQWDQYEGLVYVDHRWRAH